MKTTNKTPKALFVICFSFLIITAYAQTHKMNFEKDPFVEIKAKAKKENKLIFMDCYTSWCGPCKRMEKETLSNDTVAKYFNDSFINCSYDMEIGEGPMLADQFQIKCYPTFLFIDGDGNIVHRDSKFMDVGEFMKFAEDALSPHNNFRTAEKNYQNNKEKAAFVFDYINKLSGTCLNYDEVLSNYLSTQKEKELIDETNWQIISNYVMDIDSREFKYVGNHLELFKEKYTEQIVNKYLSDAFSTAIFWCDYDTAKTIIDLENILIATKKFKLKDYDETFAFNSKLNFFKIRNDANSYIDLAMKDGDRFITTSYFQNRDIYLNTDNSGFLNKSVGWMEKYIENKRSDFDWAINGDVNEFPNKQVQYMPIKSYAMYKVFEPLDAYAVLFYKLKNKKAAMQHALDAIKIADRFGFDSDKTKELLAEINKLN